MLVSCPYITSCKTPKIIWYSGWVTYLFKLSNCSENILITGLANNNWHLNMLINLVDSWTFVLFFQWSLQRLCPQLVPRKPHPQTQITSKVIAKIAIRPRAIKRNHNHLKTGIAEISLVNTKKLNSVHVADESYEDYEDRRTISYLYFNASSRCYFCVNM